MHLHYSSSYWQQPSKLAHLLDTINWQVNADIQKQMSSWRKIWATKWGRVTSNWKKYEAVEAMDQQSVPYVRIACNQKWLLIYFNLQLQYNKLSKKMQFNWSRNELRLSARPGLSGFIPPDIYFQVPSCHPGIPVLIQALEAQQAIGKEWITQGMVSLHWHQFKIHDPNIPWIVWCWSQVILNEFWKMAGQLRQAQNDAIQNSRITQSYQYLRAEVTKEFKKGMYLVPWVDYHWVQGTLPELLKWSNSFLQQWLQTVQTVMSRKIDDMAGQQPTGPGRFSRHSLASQTFKYLNKQRKNIYEMPQNQQLVFKVWENGK